MMLLPALLSILIAVAGLTEKRLITNPRITLFPPQVDPDEHEIEIPPPLISIRLAPASTVAAFWRPNPVEVVELTEKLTASPPGPALTSWIAARKVQTPLLATVSHLPSPGFASL